MKSSRVAFNKFLMAGYAGTLVAAVLTIGGCPISGTGGTGGTGGYNNTTDPTNGGASYIGSAACAACHPGIADTHRVHGHANILKRVQGSPPSYPPEGTHAGVPQTPPGKTWADISYVVGGYIKIGRYVDQMGYLLTTGLQGTTSQWNLGIPPNGTPTGLTNYLPNATAPVPYDYFSCFRCHAVGAMAQDPSNPMFQDGRPGLIGTWQEEGVQCESCHGPGSHHPPNSFLRNIYVNNSATACGNCHSYLGGSDTITAENGFIRHNEQFAELRSSGGHKDFACTYCHAPHVSTVYDRQNGIRNACTACHSDQNMALHKGKVYRRGDYEEPLTCESCHMSYAAQVGSAASQDLLGPLARVGDTRTHIFRISTADGDYTTMLTPDMTQVVKDDLGRAAVTVDFVCLRCHNAAGLPTLVFTVERAAEIAQNVHLPTELNQ